MKKIVKILIMILGISKAFASIPVKKFGEDSLILKSDKYKTNLKIDINQLIHKRWWSIDPKANKFPSQSPYNFVENNPINAIDPNGETTFFIHGTNQSAKEINSNRSIYLRETINYLHKTLSTSNIGVDYGFDWSKYSSWLNCIDDRKIAALQLADYVIKNNAKGDNITLIGYSHGGNVAIQAAQIIFDKTGQKVNIMTLATPTNNQKRLPDSYNNSKNNFIKMYYESQYNKSIENPEYNTGINDMYHFWLSKDMVQVLPLISNERTYNSPKVLNYPVDDGGKDWQEYNLIFPGKEAHGFPYFPSMIKNTVENSQFVKPQTPVLKKDE